MNLFTCTSHCGTMDHPGENGMARTPSALPGQGPVTLTREVSYNPPCPTAWQREGTGITDAPSGGNISPLHLSLSCT